MQCNECKGEEFQRKTNIWPSTLEWPGSETPNFDMMRLDTRMYKTNIAISPTDEISTSSILQGCVKDGQDS